MDLDYKTYGDYDVYSDVSFGPSYGKEITQGTIYDAEDHGEPPSGIMSKPTTTYSSPARPHGNGNQGRSDRSPTGHGKSGMGRDPEDRM